jgi:type IV secretory pathway TraG/TraD family ATPase VirD4
MAGIEGVNKVKGVALYAVLFFLAFIRACSRAGKSSMLDRYSQRFPYSQIVSHCRHRVATTCLALWLQLSVNSAGMLVQAQAKSLGSERWHRLAYVTDYMNCGK